MTVQEKPGSSKRSVTAVAKDANCRLREEEDSSFGFRTMSVKSSVFFSKSKLDKKFQTVSKLSKKSPIFKIQPLSGLLIQYFNLKQI